MDRYNYFSEWANYAYRSEGKRFLTDEELIKELCTCTDTERNLRGGSGIPLLVKDSRMYCLKDGHTLVEGESGSKKSRAVVRNAIISAVLNQDSTIVTDVKGELSSDLKILGLLRDYGVQTVVIDFRTFDKDGFNFFDYPYEMMKNGNVDEALCSISRFISALTGNKKTVDEFWNDSAHNLLLHTAEILLTALAQKKGDTGRKYANIASLLSFVSNDSKRLGSIMEKIAACYPKDCLHNPAELLHKGIYQNPDRTYACIISTTMGIVKDFTQSKVTDMLSYSTFDIAQAYSRPMCIFLVVPDESSAFDKISGIVLDNLYERLVSEYTKTYQNRKESKCKVHFICDEFCNIQLNGMAAKISASRSRNITWMLIYQSGKQLKETYQEEAGTILGNCKNYIFLGSSDIDVLNDVSNMCGKTEITYSGRPENILSVNDLRKMRKCREYKEAVFIRDGFVYCAKLPDYEQFKFLNKYSNGKTISANCNLVPVGVYKPDMLLKDLEMGKLKFPYAC